MPQYCAFAVALISFPMLRGTRKSSGVPATCVNFPFGIRFPSVAMILDDAMCTTCPERSWVSLYASRFQNWCADSIIGVSVVALAEMAMSNTELFPSV